MTVIDRENKLLNRHFPLRHFTPTQSISISRISRISRLFLLLA